MNSSDEKFLEQFENQSLAPDHFDHYGHLRLAWLYLRTYSLQEAIDKVTSGLEAYATSLGAYDKFQHTLTEAIVRIMAYRMEQGDADTLDAYLADNRDLVDDMGAVVGAHYSHELLNSQRARSRFVPPDLAPLTSADGI